MSDTEQKPAIVYDGKLTAWLQIEIDKVLHEVLPLTEKYYEGVNGGFEIKSLNPKHCEAREKLVNITRRYSAKEHSGSYGLPVETKGDVHHGFGDN